MRTKKALMNTVALLIYQIVAAICGLILPRLILSSFGSNYNGIVSSINQFINCVVLLRSGVGAVTRFALYKPLSEKNYVSISRIIKATELFMRKIAIIFVVFCATPIHRITQRRRPADERFDSCAISQIPVKSESR